MKFFALLTALFTTLSAWAANPQVEMSTSMGTIVLELYPEKAPKTVDNFLEYAKSGFYNGTIFHRVIAGFMIQGGGFDQKMTQKATRAPVQNEANNGLRNELGTIAMARTADPHSATAQFFINVANNSPLNYPSRDGYGYTVFGKVTKGLDVVQAMSKVSTGIFPKGGIPFQDVPDTPIVIENVKVLTPSK